MQKAKAEAKVSIDFPTESDAKAMARALIPEIAALRKIRASVRVTRHRRTTKLAFYAKDLVALRAMVNSFLRFAITWRRLSETLSEDQKRIGRTRQTRSLKQGEFVA
ncbi:MAG TPA: KEOPS complex subunit Pcc1 [Candidatus Acidoferrum sp.]|nr:KEOPS complex subunit Pcc1 [Candidatus Acidoferrum sp.]